MFPIINECPIVILIWYTTSLLVLLNCTQSGKIERNVILLSKQTDFEKVEFSKIYEIKNRNYINKYSTNHIPTPYKKKKF